MYFVTKIDINEGAIAEIVVYLAGRKIVSAIFIKSELENIILKTN